MNAVVNEPTLVETDIEADLHDRAVCAAQQRRRALEPACHQVGVRRLAEGAAKLAAEVGARKPGRPGEVIDTQRLTVAGVGEVPGAEQMA